MIDLSQSGSATGIVLWTVGVSGETHAHIKAAIQPIRVQPVNRFKIKMANPFLLCRHPATTEGTKYTGRDIRNNVIIKVGVLLCISASVYSIA